MQHTLLRCAAGTPSAYTLQRRKVVLPCLLARYHRPPRPSRYCTVLPGTLAVCIGSPPFARQPARPWPPSRERKLPPVSPLPLSRLCNRNRLPKGKKRTEEAPDARLGREEGSPPCRRFSHLTTAATAAAAAAARNANQPAGLDKGCFLSTLVIASSLALYSFRAFSTPACGSSRTLGWPSQ
jgi:hypothetical protein